MTGASFNKPFKPFGLNIKVPERTLKQAGNTLEQAATGAVTPLFQYLEKNENIFNGDVDKEIKKYNVANFNTGMLLQQEDSRVNGEPPSFDMHF